MYGRHFDDKSQICSLITRDSIDALKEFFRDDMQDDDWRTCIKLKKIYEIN
jgi:translation initiation factor 5B